MQYIYVEIGFVGLLQKKPSDFNAKLTIGGHNAVSKYDLVVGNGDPGDKNPLYDTFDYPQFEIVAASRTKPEGYPSAYIEYQGETGTYKKAKYSIISVPDGFQIPSDIPSIGGGTTPGGGGTPTDPGDGDNEPDEPALLQPIADAAKKVIIDQLGKRFGAAAAVVEKIKDAVQLWDTLKKHMGAQFDLIKKVDASEITVEEFLRRSNKATSDFEKDLLDQADIPKEAKTAIKALSVVFRVSGTDSGQDYNDFQVELDKRVKIATTGVDTTMDLVGRVKVVSGSANTTFDVTAAAVELAAGAGNDTVVEVPTIDTSDIDAANGQPNSFNGGLGLDTYVWKPAGDLGRSKLSIDLQRGEVLFKAFDGTASDPQVIYNYFTRLISFENASGSTGNDTFTGSAVGNRLEGNGGRDTFKGMGGDDKLKGGKGADKLWGGDGKKGLGADTFVFTKISDSTAKKTGRDTIYDFTHEDHIDLRGLDASTKKSGNQAFKWIGTDDFSGKAGELRFVKKASDTYVYADTNGDKKADFSVHLDDAVKLLKADFLL